MTNVLEKQNIAEVVKETGLKHIAVIMDGNRRWAKAHCLPTAIGHKKGVDSLKNVVKACHKFGIKYLTVYAFSTENWNRKQEEVDYLMELFALTIKNELKELHESNVVINFIGDLSRLSQKLQDEFQKAVERTKNNTGVCLQIAVNYGSRHEIVGAIKSIAQKVLSEEISVDDINEEVISKELYTKNVPDPDLLVRTSGEMRISNYLLWQIAYSEILVTSQFWPDFNEDSVADAVLEYKNRQRRFGE